MLVARKEVLPILVIHSVMDADGFQGVERIMRIKALDFKAASFRFTFT
jgi:hypothetical protein